MSQELFYIIPVAHIAAHSTINAKVMGLIPWESKNW